MKLVQVIKKVPAFPASGLDAPAIVYNHGRPQILPTAEPFFFVGGSSKPAVFLIHGFTGTPKEIRGLGEFLNQHAYTADLEERTAKVLTAQGMHIRSPARTGRCFRTTRPISSA